MTRPTLFPGRRCALLILSNALLLAAGGCLDSPAGPDTAPTGSTTLVLEVEPRDVHHPVPIFVTRADSPPDATLEAELSVDVALGDAYPSEITLVFDTAYGQCIGSYGDKPVSFAIEAMVPRPGSESLSAGMQGNDSLSISATEDGTFDIDLTGFVGLEPECAAKEGFAANRPFQLSLKINVFTPAATRIVLPQRCASSASPQLESPAEFSTFVSDLWSVVVLDGSGEEYRPINATRPRPGGLTVEASPGLAIALSEPDETTAKRLEGANIGLAGLVATGRGTLKIRASTGEVVTMAVGDASDITAFESTFGLTAVKGSQGPLPEGDSFAVPEPNNSLTRSMQLIVPQQWAGSNGYCTLPNPSNYEVSSTTPGVCSAVDGPPAGDVQIPIFQTSAELVSDGRCQLKVTGPSATEAQLFAMSFEGAERLHEPPSW